MIDHTYPLRTRICLALSIDPLTDDDGLLAAVTRLKERCDISDWQRVKYFVSDPFLYAENSEDEYGIADACNLLNDMTFTLDVLETENDAQAATIAAQAAEIERLKAALKKIERVALLTARPGKLSSQIETITRAALLAPAPQPAPEPPSIPELTPYQKAQIERVNQQKQDERQGKHG